jgi:hypothetical protein
MATVPPATDENQMDLFAEASAGRIPAQRTTTEETRLPSRPVDAGTADILKLIDGDPLHESDRAAVVQAIFATADEHGGEINPNIVRPRIPTWVQPRVVGATYNSLAARGLIAWTGEWVTSDDARGRNSGKPARLYRLQTKGAA